MRSGSRVAIVMAALLLLMLLVSGLFYTYLDFNGRRIFNEQITALTHRRVEARSVKAAFPAWIIVKGLSIDGLLSCERVTILVDAGSLFGKVRRISRMELESPVIVWHREGSRVAVQSTVQGTSAPPSGQPLVLAHLLVRDGTLKIQTDDASGIKQGYEIGHIQLRVDNVLVTDTPGHTEFALSASLEKLNVPFLGHFLKAGGWFNWAARDMDGVAQVIDDDGRVGVDAKLSSRQNDMTVFGTVKLAADQGPQATGARVGLLENVVLGALSSTQTDIVADFSLRTKMDRFDPDVVKLSGHITTGLNSSATSGNIVAGLKAASEELLKEPSVLGEQK